jgi:hypothetical protein
MSYNTFKGEILAGLNKAHKDKTKGSRVIAQAYVNLIMRSFEGMTGGGIFLTMPASLGTLQSGLQQVFLTSLTSQTKRMSQYDMWAPYIYAAWVGQTAVGPIGSATVLYTGNWKGTPIPESGNEQVWLDVLIGIMSTHILTLSGTYLNFYTGLVTPWSGVTLLVLP